LRRIIVDTSVVLAGLFKGGTVRDILLNAGDVEFVAPKYIASEIERDIPEVVFRTKKPEATVRAVLEDLLGAIELIPAEVYSGSIARAMRIAERVDADGDADYIALAPSLGSPIWTLDKDFDRVRDVVPLKTKDVEQG